MAVKEEGGGRKGGGDQELVPIFSRSEEKDCRSGNFISFVNTKDDMDTERKREKTYMYASVLVV